MTYCCIIFFPYLKNASFIILLELSQLKLYIVSFNYFMLSFCYAVQNQKKKTEANYLMLSINYVYKKLLLPWALWYARLFLINNFSMYKNIVNVLFVPIVIVLLTTKNTILAYSRMWLNKLKSHVAFSFNNNFDTD